MGNEKYLRVIDILADRIHWLDLDNSLLKHANEKMEAKIKELEEKLAQVCEEMNKEVS